MINRKISLALGIREKKDIQKVDFKVTFTNFSGQTTSVYFSNSSGKAERVGLNVLDGSGERLEPAEFTVINLVGSEAEEHELLPGGSFEYSLVASYIKPGVLKFSCASYLLKPGASYRFLFKAQGLESAEVVWVPPIWWDV